MNLEEEVFKIGKQLEKIVGQDGAVSQTFVVKNRPVDVNLQVLSQLL